MSIKVKGASGATFEVLTSHERKWFKDNLKRYMEEYRFGNIADLQDLDRLMGLELLSYRYASWLARGLGIDYEDIQFDEKAVRDHKQKVDQEIRLIKKHMGMDRKGRTESEQESLGEYLKALLRRAEEFGVHRDKQVASAIDLFNELKKLVGLYERCDAEERSQLSVEMVDIFKWIQETAIPTYDAIDDAFRKNQRIWIKEVS